MKNIKRIAYIVVIVILVVLSLTIYTNASKSDQQGQKDKVFAEIKYLETKLANLLNSMNHIEARNYSVISSEISKATTEKSNSANSSSNQGSKSGGGSSQEESSGGANSGGGGGEQGGSSQGGQASNEASSEGSASQEEKKNQKFELKETGVLTNEEDINWDIVKREVEGIYVSIPSITMDFYELNLNQEDILGFNTQYDNLTKAVKTEKKEEVLAGLTSVYDFLPKFLRGSSQDALYTTLIETKSHVFKAYSKLDGGNWQEISNDMKNAIDTYSKLLTNTEIEARKQYNVSKGYIMINELQNATNLKEPSVFLIKYKNLLEEFNNI